MKKVLLGILFCAASTLAMAQQYNEPVTQRDGYIADKKPLVLNPALQNHLQQANKMEKVEGWYNYMAAVLKTLGLEQINEYYTIYSNFSIFPDSTVLQIYGDGAGGQTLGKVGIHGIGQVFDPKSSFFEDPDQGLYPLSKYNAYKWDSVQFFYYGYTRFNPEPDTLIFQFYTSKNQGIRTATFGGGEKSAYTTYSYLKNLGTGNISTYKYILTDNDSTTPGAIRAITVPTDEVNGGISVARDQLAAFTVSYRPGHSYSPGDTLDERFNPTKKLNHMRLLLGQDGEKPAGESYNHSLKIITHQRHNVPPAPNSGDWRGAYIPGDAWNDYNEYLFSSFYITSNNVGIADKNSEGYGISNIYPNPVTSKANVQFELGKGENVTITLYNALGQKVNTIADGNYTAGKHNVSFSADNLNSGVYFYTINAGVYTKTMKFTVAK